MEDNKPVPETPAAPSPLEAPKSSLLARPAGDPPVTKGRIVYYLQHAGEEPHVALVVKVWSNECVNLKVTDEYGQDYFQSSVCKGTGVGQWLYPGRV